MRFVSPLYFFQVELIGGIKIERWASLLLQSNQGDHTDWAVTLLVGVFGEDEAMLLRMKPTKTNQEKLGFKSFSKYFLMKAKRKLLRIT